MSDFWAWCIEKGTLVVIRYAATMRTVLTLVVLFLSVPSCHAQEPGRLPQALPPIEVYFSPKGGCTEAVIKEIDAAQKTILVQAYSFTSARIAKALVEAHKRGVYIEVILDKSQRTEKYSSADFVRNAGIPTFIDDRHAIAHSKIMLLDGQTVITGSFNFTKAAEESNAENLLVIRSPELAAKYTASWKAHREHSERYERREKGYSETQASREVPHFTGFIASRNSPVFHKADCKSVAKIAEKNRVQYASRDDAVRTGKKPCGECRP